MSMLAYQPVSVHASGHVAGQAWTAERATSAAGKAMLVSDAHNWGGALRVAHAGLLGGTGIAAAIVMASRGKRSRRPRRQHALHAVSDDDKEADLLMKAGLRNLLGVEDNKLAQKLQAACQVAEDKESCLKDSEIKVQVAEDEFEQVGKERDTLQTDLDAMKQELETVTSQYLKEKQIEERVQGLQKDLKEAESKLSSLEESLQIENKHVSKIESDFSEQRARRTKVELEMEDVKRELAKVKVDLQSA